MKIVRVMFQPHDRHINYYDGWVWVDKGNVKQPHAIKIKGALESIMQQIHDIREG